MANVRTAFGAMLSTITTASTTTANTIEQAANGIDMLGAFIAKARREQAESHIVQAHDFRFKLLAEAASAKTKFVKDIAKEHSDPASKQSFDTYFAEYASLFPAEAQP